MPPSYQIPFQGSTNATPASCKQRASVPHQVEHPAVVDVVIDVEVLDTIVLEVDVCEVVALDVGEDVVTVIVIVDIVLDGSAVGLIVGGGEGVVVLVKVMFPSQLIVSFTYSSMMPASSA